MRSSGNWQREETTRGAPGDISLGVAKPTTRKVRRRARSGPGASPHLPSRELNPISFSSEFPLLCKGPFSPRQRRPALPGAVRFCSFPSRLRATGNHECYYLIFHSERAPTTDSQQALGRSRSVQDQRGRGARPPSPTLKRKIPAKCLRPRRTVLQGSGGSSGLPWGHFSVTCGNAPLCSAHRVGNIFLQFSQNTPQVRS